MSVRYLPYVSRDLSVSTDNPPLEFCPEVKLGTYWLGGGFIEATQFAHSFPYDRHAIRGFIDATDYQTAIDAAGIAGTLSTNFVTSYIVETSAIPGGIPIGAPQFVATNPVTGGLEGIYTFRPQPNWTTKVLNFVFLFNHNGQDDYIVVPVVVNMAPYNQTNAGVSLVVDPDGDKVYVNGQPVDEICIGSEVEIKFDVCFPGSSMALVVIHERDGEFAGEYDRYDASLGTLFPTLTESPILDVDLDSGACNTYTTKLDEGNIQAGDCFYFIFKPTFPEPPGCADEFCVVVDVSVTPGISQILTIDWDSDLGENATYNFNFEHLDQSGYPSSVVWSSGDATGTNSQAISLLNAEIFTLTITVVLENGCTYVLSWQEQLAEGQTITNEICN